MMNLISVRRGRFFKMFFVRPEPETLAKCPSIFVFSGQLLGYIDGRGNENPCLRGYCITHERGKLQFRFSDRAWTLNSRRESVGRSATKHMAVHRGQQRRTGRDDCYRKRQNMLDFLLLRILRPVDKEPWGTSKSRHSNLLLHQARMPLPALLGPTSALVQGYELFFCRNGAPKSSRP